jgi:hypothetical protein
MFTYRYHYCGASNPRSHRLELIALSKFIAIVLLLAETIHYLDTLGIVAPVCGRGGLQPYVRRRERGGVHLRARTILMMPLEFR